MKSEASQKMISATKTSSLITHVLGKHCHCEQEHCKQLVQGLPLDRLLIDSWLGRVRKNHQNQVSSGTLSVGSLPVCLSIRKGLPACLSGKIDLPGNRWTIHVPRTFSWADCTSGPCAPSCCALPGNVFDHVGSLVLQRAPPAFD